MVSVLVIAVMSATACGPRRGDRPTVWSESQSGMAAMEATSPWMDYTVVVATADGQKLRLRIDTLCSVCQLTSAAAARLHLTLSSRTVLASLVASGVPEAAARRNGGLGRGWALRQRLPGSYVRGLEICGVTLPAVYFVVPSRELPGPTTAPDLDGFIGMPVLSKVAAAFDYQRQLVRMWFPGHIGPRDLRQSGYVLDDTLPAHAGPLGLPWIRCQLNGRGTWWFHVRNEEDYSVIPAALAIGAGVPPTGSGHRAHAHANYSLSVVSHVRVGTRTFRRLPVIVSRRPSDARLPELDGGFWRRTGVMILDMPAKTLYLAHNVPVQAAAAPRSRADF
ncbi:MAG: hypothetical protein KGJ62_14745 [Armatimonadetes bacterium]|nr:hypothetical protein [Armatimonadota bacterium]MDE2206360.1 hypothetical protein [Armatimonadota bacterium]